jgi:hypothetical protein
MLKKRAVQRREEISPPGAAAAHDPHVQFIPQLPDRDIQICQIEEAPLVQPRSVPKPPIRHDDPAVCHLRRSLDLRLVAGLAGAGGIAVP